MGITAAALIAAAVPAADLVLPASACTAGVAILSKGSSVEAPAVPIAGLMSGENTTAEAGGDGSNEQRLGAVILSSATTVNVVPALAADFEGKIGRGMVR